jgi:hypothetical protein
MNDNRIMPTCRQLDVNVTKKGEKGERVNNSNLYTFRCYLLVHMVASSYQKWTKYVCEIPICCVKLSNFFCIINLKFSFNILFVFKKLVLFSYFRYGENVKFFTLLDLKVGHVTILDAFVSLESIVTCGCFYITSVNLGYVNEHPYVTILSRLTNTSWIV